jgi:hypothetical protein
MKTGSKDFSVKKSRLRKHLHRVIDLFCEIVRELARWFWRIVDFVIFWG